MDFAFKRARFLSARFSSTWVMMALVLPVFVAMSTGCRNGWLQAPGPLNQQQARAVVHDPYPQNDIAPYEAASRPPDYQQPLPEPVRNRISRDAMFGNSGN